MAAKGRWGLIVAVGTGTFVAGIGTSYLLPKANPIPTYSYDHPEDMNFVPGGLPCVKSSVIRLKSLREIKDREVDCAEKREQHRLDVNDLVQQTRAADASEAQASVAIQALWMTYIQTIGGIATLIAAIAAAKFARDAALEASRGSDAAHKSLNHAQEIAAIQLRPYIKMVIESFDLTVYDGDDGDWRLNTIFSFENMGATPALNMKVRYAPTFQTDGWPSSDELPSKEWGNAVTIVTGDHLRQNHTVVFKEASKQSIIMGSHRLGCAGEINFMDVSGNNYNAPFSFYYQYEFDEPAHFIGNEKIDYAA